MIIIHHKVIPGGHNRSTCPIPVAALLATATNYYRQACFLGMLAFEPCWAAGPCFLARRPRGPEVNDFVAAGIDIFLQSNHVSCVLVPWACWANLTFSRALRMAVWIELGYPPDPRVEGVIVGMWLKDPLLRCCRRCCSLSNSCRDDNPTNSNHRSGIASRHLRNCSSRARQDGVNHRAPSRCQQGTADTDRMWHLRRRSTGNGRSPSRRSIEGAAKHRLG